MKQKELLKRVRDYLATSPPESWEQTTTEPQAEYAVFWRFEQGGEEMAVAVLPAAIQWGRVRGAKPRKTHFVDVVLYGQNESIETLVRIQDGLEDLAETFMYDGGPIDDADCMSVATVDGAAAGYDETSVFKTGEPFRAGIRLEFWCD